MQGPVFKTGVRHLCCHGWVRLPLASAIRKLFQIKAEPLDSLLRTGSALLQRFQILLGQGLDLRIVVCDARSSSPSSTFAACELRRTNCPACWGSHCRERRISSHDTSGRASPQCSSVAAVFASRSFRRSSASSFDGIATGSAAESFEPIPNFGS